MRLRLLTAAAQWMAQSGRQDPSIEDFVRTAGVARGTYYNHYTSVSEIYTELWDRVGARPFARIEAQCAGIDQPLERMAAKSRMLLSAAQHDQAWGWVIFALLRHDLGPQHAQLDFPLSDIREGQAQRVLSVDSIQCARDVSAGVLRAALEGILSDDTWMDPKDYATTMCKMTLCALGLGPLEADRLLAAPLPADAPINA